jgi:hypothetical protein
VTAYMLPRRVALNEDGLTRAHGWTRFGPADSFLEKKDFIFADTHSCLAVRLAKENKTVLGMCGGQLRELRVFGQPKDVSSLSYSCG